MSSIVSLGATSYDLDQPDLPDEIAETAFRSGGYPYDKRLKRKRYDKELRLLQIELAKLQYWVRETGERIIILFEGRDAAGKGGTIRRFTHHLNPRQAHIVALTKPSETEQGQWYFQRYIAHLPTAGHMALYDRSWYNRAGVERVMGFCSEEQVETFFEEAPRFEAMLVRNGIHLIKLWLTIGREMQLKRFHDRKHDLLKRWKLSPIDIAALGKWNEYARARDDMFANTHTQAAPWTVVRANDKRRARLNAMRHVLSQFAYDGKDEGVVGEPDPGIVGSGGKFFED